MDNMEGGMKESKVKWITDRCDNMEGGMKEGKVKWITWKVG